MDKECLYESRCSSTVYKVMNSASVCGSARILEEICGNCTIPRGKHITVQPKNTVCTY